MIQTLIAIGMSGVFVVVAVFFDSLFSAFFLPRVALRKGLRGSPERTLDFISLYFLKLVWHKFSSKEWGAHIVQAATLTTLLCLYLQLPKANTYVLAAAHILCVLSLGVWAAYNHGPRASETQAITKGLSTWLLLVFCLLGNREQQGLVSVILEWAIYFLTYATVISNLRRIMSPLIYKLFQFVWAVGTVYFFLPHDFLLSQLGELLTCVVAMTVGVLHVLAAELIDLAAAKKAESRSTHDVSWILVPTFLCLMVLRRLGI